MEDRPAPAVALGDLLEFALSISVQKTTMALNHPGRRVERQSNSPSMVTSWRPSCAPRRSNTAAVVWSSFQA